MSSGERVTHCPICGEVNACQLSEASKEQESSANKKPRIEDCWCTKVKGKLDVKLLPDSLDNFPTSCVCQKCWEKYQKK